MFGTDPELFIVNNEGKPVRPDRFLPDRTAKERLSTHSSDYNHQISVFRDGYAAEINVPPTHCREGLAGSVLSALRYLQEKVGKEGCTITAKPTVEIDLADLEGAPSDLLEFGCDPSFDAYTGVRKTVSLDARTHPYRYAGGHMHYGFYNSEAAAARARDLEQVATLVKWCDLCVGLPLTLWFDRQEQYMRRKYYGQAGEFRPQVYGPTTFGVEYRVPGPELWAHVPVASFAFGVMRNLVSNWDKLAWDSAVDDDLREAINLGNPKLGAKLLRELPGWFTPDLILKIANERMFPMDFHVWPSPPTPEGYISRDIQTYPTSFGWTNWQRYVLRNKK